MNLKINKDGEKSHIDILSSYKEGSRTGKISLFKNEEDIYQIIVNWDDPRYENIIMFSGELEECIDFSYDRFGLSKDKMNSLLIE